jgi:hypothetical protein
LVKAFALVEVPAEVVTVILPLFALAGTAVIFVAGDDPEDSCLRHRS